MNLIIKKMQIGIFLFMGICLYVFAPLAHSSMVMNTNIKDTSTVIKSELLKSPKEFLIAQHRHTIRRIGIPSNYRHSRDLGISSPYRHGRNIGISSPYRHGRDVGISSPYRHGRDVGISSPYRRGRDMGISSPYHRIRRGKHIPYLDQGNIQERVIYDPYHSPTSTIRPRLYQENCTLVEQRTLRSNGSTTILRKFCY